VPPLFVRLRDVIRVTGLSRSALYAHLRNGELDAVRVRGRTHISIDSLAHVLPRSAAAGDIVAELGPLGIPVETVFDATSWLEAWKQLGGVVRHDGEILIALPLADEDARVMTARIAHLRAGLRDAHAIGEIRKAVGTA
jgi:hypothetical protein